jgi:Mg-chelatase subunit ChlD
MEKSNLILIDTSASMAGDKISQARDGAIDFARSSRLPTALAVFGERAAMVTDPTDVERFARKVGGLRTGVVGHSTNIGAGLKLANKFADSFSPQSVVVVTDGQPDDAENALAAAENLKRRNIEIICIGTDDADQEFLEKLAGKGKAIHVERGSLRKAIAQAQLLLK